MNHIAIAAYLGIIKMGRRGCLDCRQLLCDEIAVRLKIANTKSVITQDFSTWGTKQLPLYEKIVRRTRLNALSLHAAHAAINRRGW